jgi:hypothetical protein
MSPAASSRELTLTDMAAVGDAVETWLRDVLVDGRAGQIAVAPLGPSG